MIKIVDYVVHNRYFFLKGVKRSVMNMAIRIMKNFGFILLTRSVFLAHFCDENMVRKHYFLSDDCYMEEATKTHFKNTNLLGHPLKMDKMIFAFWADFMN